MPVVRAENLGARSGRGWAFRHVDLAVCAGDLLVLTGRQGSGRTSLLLALAGRFATQEGRLVRDGAAALGHVPGVHEPEPALTVAELVEERALLLGTGRSTASRLVPVTRRRQLRADRAARVRAALDRYADELPPAAQGRDLTPYQRQLLGLVLADLTDPRLVVADDVDTDLDADERARLWAELDAVARTGRAVVVAAREPAPIPTATHHQMDRTS